MTIPILAALVLAGGLGGSALRAEEPAAGLTTESAAELVEGIMQEVAELRGLEFSRPVPVEVIDDDRAREHALSRLQSFQSEEQLQAIERAYKLLGLLPPDASILQAYLDALREQAGGFYDPASGSFYLLDDIPAALGAVVTAHELTHALEDQHFDLDERLRGAIHDDDLLFALGSVHEGSASLLMTVYMTRQMMSGKLDAEALQAVAESEAAKADVLLSMPAVIQRQLIGPYVLGSAFYTDGNIFAMMSGGYPAEKVNRSYTSGPLSSEQILHPAKYWDEAARDDPLPVTLGSAGQALGRRWSKEFEGVLGEITLGLIVGAPTPMDLQDMMTIYDAARWTNAAAAGWGGDRWELWSRGDRAVVLLSTVWDGDDDAAEFAAALEGGSGMRWKLDGSRVAIVAGDAGKKTDAVLEAMLAAKAPENAQATE